MEGIRQRRRAITSTALPPSTSLQPGQPIPQTTFYLTNSVRALQQIRRVQQQLRLTHDKSSLSLRPSLKTRLSQEAASVQQRAKVGTSTLGELVTMLKSTATTLITLLRIRTGTIMALEQVRWDREQLRGRWGQIKRSGRLASVRVSRIPTT